MKQQQSWNTIQIHSNIYHFHDSTKITTSIYYLNQKRLTKLEKPVQLTMHCYITRWITPKKRPKGVKEFVFHDYRCIRDATLSSGRLLKAQASSLWREISSVVVFHWGKITANSNSSTRIIPTDRFTPGFLLGLRAYNNAPRIKSML